VSVPVFISNFGYAGVLLLLLAAVIFMLNSLQKKTAAKLNRLNATYSDVETILVRVTNSLDAINLKLADIDAKQKHIADAEDRIRQEMTRLADGFGEQSQVSKAIDLAREGASASEIMLSTNLSEEEAEAIATFHSRTAR
jgi:septal ring factor EnvC (AmiA/AmiB activator)|tara:strand:+ start:1453 stop:1872 length:420 start_codon:yes stop_codon:yes gene_type:complete